MSVLWLFPAVAAVALLLTALLRRYALAQGLMDVPGARSSHAAPTPRGGGVAFVVAFLAGIMWLWGTEMIASATAVALVGAGGVIALVGFVDDHGHVPPRWRLLTHFVAAGWALAWMGGFPPLTVLGTTVDLGIVGHLLAAVSFVWLINLYNFMDGIDGIAGIEAVTVCLGGVLLYAVASVEGDGWVLPFLLLSAVAGFLYWNFPRARIFMGDGGSGFIGVTLGILALQAAWVAPELFWGWAILLGAFVVDATVTLLRRAQRGEKLHEAHRSHAYQHLARWCGSHPPISLAFGAMNVGWLLPLAVLAAAGFIDGLVAMAIAYAPLVLLALRFQAGVAEPKL